ncbi:hypothetical protein [Nitrospira sp. BLG_2]|uniref:hypothetical protein n=1 Tax=Nitrospira sp. BLG_2 TaxID=3397507 RepID=UPI003B9AEFFE
MATQLEKNRVLAWLSGFEAARQADRARLRQEPVDRQRSVRLALGLMKLIHARGGYAIEDIQIREQAVEQVRQRWVMLKKGVRW